MIQTEDVIISKVMQTVEQLRCCRCDLGPTDDDGSRQNDYLKKVEKLSILCPSHGKLNSQTYN